MVRCRGSGAAPTCLAARLHADHTCMSQEASMIHRSTCHSLCVSWTWDCPRSESSCFNKELVLQTAHATLTDASSVPYLKGHLHVLQRPANCQQQLQFVVAAGANSGASWMSILVNYQSRQHTRHGKPADACRWDASPGRPHLRANTCFKACSLKCCLALEG